MIENIKSESSFLIQIEIPKNCYLPEEILSGCVNIIKKININENEIQIKNPSIEISLIELEHYEYLIGTSNETKKENVDSQTELLNTSKTCNNLLNAILDKKIVFPFSFEIPKKTNPTCIFSNNAYNKHILKVKFAELNLEASKIIIIKNGQIFNLENKLFKSPIRINNEIKKSKLMLFSKGSIYVYLSLLKNSFNYGEKILFEMKIDCTEFYSNLYNIKCSLIRDIRKNYKENHNKIRFHQKDEILKKVIEIKDKQKIHVFRDFIQYNDNYIENCNKLDNEDSIFIPNDTSRLYPSSNGGLLCVNYYFKLHLSFNSYLTTGEDIIIPIEFYTGENKNKEITEAEFQSPELFANSSERNNILIIKENKQIEDSTNVAIKINQPMSMLKI